MGHTTSKEEKPMDELLEIGELGLQVDIPNEMQKLKAANKNLKTALWLVMGIGAVLSLIALINIQNNENNTKQEAKKAV
ncbi:MAG: hypothetical protein COC01_02090 [Bacteroidetes bacterium]|nr:MAG: hypothetical protein COC01_02090 [Bacteroidota bacterium]